MSVVEKENIVRKCDNDCQGEGKILEKEREREKVFADMLYSMLLAFENFCSE